MNAKLSFYRSPALFVVCFLLLDVCISQAQKAELVVQVGHAEYVLAVSFSHDGKYIVTGSADGTAKLWEVATGKEIRTFTGHSDFVESVSFSYDGRYLVTGSNDSTAKLWDLTTGKELRTFRGHSDIVSSLSLSSDDKYLVTGSRDNTAKLWEVATGRVLHTFISEHSITSVCLSKESKYLVTAGTADGTARLWEVATGQEIRAFSGHSNIVKSVSLISDGKYLVTGSLDNTAKLWEIQTSQKIRSFRGHSDWITSVSLSSDGKYLVTGSLDQTAKLWEVATGKALRTFRGHSSGITSVSLSSDGKYLVTGSALGGKGNLAKLWEVATGKELRTLSGYSYAVTSVSLSSDDKYLVTGSADNTAKLWEVATGKTLLTFRGHSNAVSSLSLSSDDKYLVTGSGDNTAKLWEVATGKTLRTFRGHSDIVFSVSLSKDSKYLVTGNWNGTTTLWEVATGKEIRTFSGHLGSVASVCLSRDGKYLVTGSANAAKLWEVVTGQVLRTFGGDYGPSNFAILSSDGKYLLTGNWNGTTTLWEVATGKEIRTFRGHSSWIASVSLSRDGKYLVTGSNDKTAKLWEVATGKEIRTFRGHLDYVSSVSLSSDGKYLVTGSADATTKIWEVNTGIEVATLISIEKNDWAVTTPDNFYTATKGAFKGVAFRIGNKVFPFEQFDLRVNRPDIVLSRMGRAPKELIDSYNQAHQKRLKKMRFSEEMLEDNFHLPEIAITTQAHPVTTRDKILHFNIKASDSKYLLDRLNVYANDVPIYGTNGIDLRDQKTRTHEQDIGLELSTGRNKIQVSVLNEKGVESLREMFEVVYSGKSAKPDLYIVTIGVSQYSDARANLKWAAKDASDLTKLLENQRKRFAKIDTIKILNRNVTKENILKLKDILVRTEVDDEVILFISGHGLLDDQFNYYFATSDIDFEHPAAKGLPYEEIEGLLDGIPARKKLLLMDTCHSGEVDKDGPVIVASIDTTKSKVKARAFRNVVTESRKGKLGLSNSFQLMQELFANLSRGSGAMVISAASGVEFAYEDQDWRNGAFTYCILEGLKSRNADLNKDGAIYVSELRDYVIDKVGKLTNGQQTPTSRRENLEFDFRVF